MVHARYLCNSDAWLTCKSQTTQQTDLELLDPAPYMVLYTLVRYLQYVNLVFLQFTIFMVISKM